MLLLTRNHFKQGQYEYSVAREHSTTMGQDSSARSPWTGCSQFLPTTQKIIQFSDGKAPKKGDKVVYVAGAFDLFHVGHLDFLEKARQKVFNTWQLLALITRESWFIGWFPDSRFAHRSCGESL